MFNSPNNTTQPNLQNSGAGSARPGLQGMAPGADTSPADAAVSVIGSDLTILGDKITIVSQNKLRVDGHVRGDVHGKQVTISSGGSVTGQVCAERIEVRGGVRGAIRAISVALHDTAKVEADIMHQRLSISDGAEFDGCARRVADANALLPVLDAEVIAAHSGHFPPHDPLG